MLDLASLRISSPEERKYERTPFGKEMLKHFLLDPEYHNMNHASFGSTPKALFELAHHYRLESERLPDQYLLYALPHLQDASRSAVAKLLNVPVETCVFVPNATTGVNTVLRNLEWNDDCNDEILYFSTIYGACGLTVDYIVSSTKKVEARKIDITYPISDADYCSALEKAIEASKAEGKRPRIAIFDTIASMPGLLVPYHDLTQVCAKHSVLSLIDGAHGIGQIKLDLSATNPDFFVSNCHKWLYVPRGCAVFYVPVRNQHLMKSPLPTSWGYAPPAAAAFQEADGETEDPKIPNIPAGKKSAFEQNFEFTGTMDLSANAVVGEAVRWREEVCGGEEAIYTYLRDLNRKGAKIVAETLGTKVMENPEGTLQNCAMSTVLLPIKTVAKGGKVEIADVGSIGEWVVATIVKEYKSFPFVRFWQGQFWARLSAQIYLDESDYEWTGQMLKEVCERINNLEYKK